MRRAAQVALLVWATASAGGCRRTVEQEARGKERPAKPAKEARVETVTDAALKQQFADAALCANRMQCAALDALRDRAVSADGDQVAKVGLAILADPTSLSDQGPGKFAFKVLRDYVDHQQQAGLLNDAKKRWFNLWTYIDARDGAQAIRLALEANLKGAHVFGIANTNSLMRKSNDALLDEVFPGTRRKRALKPNESLISIEKAQRMLGYKPEFDWKG